MFFKSLGCITANNRSRPQGSRFDVIQQLSRIVELMSGDCEGLETENEEFRFELQNAYNRIRVLEQKLGDARRSAEQED